MFNRKRSPGSPGSTIQMIFINSLIPVAIVGIVTMLLITSKKNMMIKKLEIMIKKDSLVLHQQINVIL